MGHILFFWFCKGIYKGIFLGIKALKIGGFFSTDQKKQRKT